MAEQMTLGQLIVALAKYDPTETVEFDFACFYPFGIASYRGFYDQLALGYDIKGGAPLVSDLLSLYRSAVGKVFEGYKGGEYLMTEDTLVWVSNIGESCSTGVTGVLYLNGSVVIQTDAIGW